jgi:3-hydroxyacyl-CoA dehydrogenase
MSLSKPIRRVGVVGTGVIGASWVAHYLSRGFEVVATDPAPNAESNLRKYVDEAWPALARAGLVTGTSGVRLSFFPSLDDAIANADFVQENGPERPDSKQSCSPKWTLWHHRIQFSHQAHPVSRWMLFSWNASIRSAA